MIKYEDLKVIRKLNHGKNDTNSVVVLMKDKQGNCFVRKAIYGVSHPLYQEIFNREIRALYKLNNCDNIVQIIAHKIMYTKDQHDPVGCIFLEYINGETLSNIYLPGLSPKLQYNILNQLLIAIEKSHENGIIHRDINPNNIMITANNRVKLIDFGICKIKELVSKGTVYKMTTNRYSAPEVNMHSENATEKSDLYSFGAVAYYLFTGEIPPSSNICSENIDNVSGIDIALKPILKKLLCENPDERYSDVFDLRNDMSPIFDRFLKIDWNITISLEYEQFSQLKYLRLIPKNLNIHEVNIINHNFIDLYMFKEEKSNVYKFLGLDYMMKCSFDSDWSVFRVLDFEKVVPSVRERLKKTFIEVIATINFIDPKYVHRQPANNNIEVKNTVDDHYLDSKSRRNIDLKYKEKYGVWRELLNLVKESIEKNILKYKYDSFTYKDGIFEFLFSKGIFLGEKSFTKEDIFIYSLKQKRRREKLVEIGHYEDDSFDNNHVIFKIRCAQQQPRLPQSGEISLDYRRNMANIQRQLDALDIIENDNYSCPFDLKGIISGVIEPSTVVFENKPKFFNKKLDMSQKEAVRKVLNSETLSLIQGPPGTGKTNVIVEIILQILLKNKMDIGLPDKKILLVSQSHPAVDKMIEDLIGQYNKYKHFFKEDLKLIRIGKDEKLNDNIKIKYGINYIKDAWIHDVKKKCHDYANLLCDDMNITEVEFEKYFKEYSKVIISDENDNIDLNIINDMRTKTISVANNKKRKILEIQRQWIERLPQCNDIDLYITEVTPIIAGTCIGFISNKFIRNVDFDYLIIDEAAKATFPELAVSFNKASKIVMVGDHKQLPPILDDNIINENKKNLNTDILYNGMFETLYEIFPDDNKHKLNVQYRMHPAIGSLISKIFYDKEILNGVSETERTIGILEYAQIAVEWITTSLKPAYKRHEKKEGKSPHITYRNDLEIKVIRQKLNELDHNVNKIVKVGVITAYSAQKYALENMINQQRYDYLQIEVDTVDAFQGSQKEIIIYSTVRSSSVGNIGFLNKEARLNVAFSRAQSLLIIVGDHKFLNNKHIRKNKFPDIIDYIENSDFCKITYI